MGEGGGIRVQLEWEKGEGGEGRGLEMEVVVEESGWYRQWRVVD
jgi:hypothetical protein